jgi:ABC-2 type transport system permease protein
VTEQATRVRAARFALQQGGGDFDEKLGRAALIEAGIPKTTVAERVVGSEETGAEGRFSQGASSQLVLFVFVNSLAGSVALIQVRRLGVTRRMFSTPTSAGLILLGEGLGRFFFAMMQAVFIVTAARLLFDVNWGDPRGAGAVMVAFALVAAGASMLFGAVLSNENQAGTLVPLALAMAAFGGSMVPLEVFSPTMRTIAKITPHAWANDAFNELLNHGGNLADVGPQIAVLVGYASVLLAVATWGLRRSIVE